MRYKVIIKGTLPGFNEYVEANRKNRYLGNKMKRDWQKLCLMYIKSGLRGIPVFLDRSESINSDRIPHTDCQLITLAVSDSDFFIE